MEYSQAKSNPYSADVLKPHDAGIRFVKEFGTNVTTKVGEPFTTAGAVPPNVPIEVNARFGILQPNSLAETSESDLIDPRGNTFLIPSWDDYPESPVLFAGAVASVIYARIGVKLTPAQSFGGSPRVDLVLAPEDYVGDQSAGEAAWFGYDATGAGMNSVQFGSYSPQRSVDGSVFDSAGGKCVYFRIFHVTDNASKSDIVAWYSFDGLCWFLLTTPNILYGFVTRRIGVAVSGAVCGSLDWFRIYEYEITALPVSGFPFFPAMPETGGRLYIP